MLLCYYYEQFHWTASIVLLQLDCKAEHTHPNQWIMPQPHKILVHYTESEGNDLNNTSEGWVSSIPVVYFRWTSWNQIHQCQKPLPPGKMILSFLKRWKKTQPWVLCPQAHEYAVVIPTQYKICMVGLIVLMGSSRLSNLSIMMHIVRIGAIVGPIHLV